MLFTVTVPGPNPNSGKVMSHMTTNPIIKMDKRWSLLSNKGSLPHSPSTTTHTFFDIKAEFCPLSLVHQNSPLSIVSGSTCGSVLFFSSLSDRPINILQGHERGVLVATFNYDESLLGNCFSSGLGGTVGTRTVLFQIGPACPEDVRLRNSLSYFRWKRCRYYMEKTIIIRLILQFWLIKYDSYPWQYLELFKTSLLNSFFKFKYCNKYW